MKRTISIAFVIAVVMSIMHDASAQTIDGSAYFSPLTDNVQPLIYGNVFSKSHLEKRGGPKAAARARAEYYPRTADRSTGTAASSDGDLHVRFDSRISREVRTSYIDSISRENGEQAAQGLRNYYERNDVHRLFETAISPYGLRGDDLADVTTAYVVVMWMTANQSALPSSAEVQGVRAQLHEIMLTEGRVPARAAERQRAAESLIYQTVTLIKVREEAQAQRNEAFLARLADSAQASMARQKFDLRGLSMTTYGLVQR